MKGTFDSIENFSNGALKFLNGDRFYGEWVSGKLRNGKLLTVDGKTKLVNEKNKKVVHYDKTTGYGVIIQHNSESIYEGLIAKEKREGYGFIYDANSSYTIGFFQNDKLSGEHLVVNPSQGEISQLTQSGKKHCGIKFSLLRNGYLVKGLVGSTHVNVTFPYQNNDYFVGELASEWGFNVNVRELKFVRGKYCSSSAGDPDKLEADEYRITEVENSGSLLSLPGVQYRNYKFAEMNLKIEQYSIDLDLVKLFDTIRMNYPNLFTDINISISYFTKRIKTSQYNRNLISQRQKNNLLFVKGADSGNGSFKGNMSMQSGTQYDSFRQITSDIQSAK